jgi:hypothetical protein
MPDKIEFKVGDVLCAKPYVIYVNDNDPRRQIPEAWMLVTKTDWDSNGTVKLLHFTPDAVLDQQTRSGTDNWTGGLEGTVHTCPSPDEWPEEVCVAMALLKMGAEDAAGLVQE